MATTYLDMLKLTRYAAELHQECAEQVSHPVEEYAPGSARLEALYLSMERAKTQTWPLNGYEVNT
jgi:hypothetical protein